MIKMKSYALFILSILCLYCLAVEETQTCFRPFSVDLTDLYAKATVQEECIAEARDIFKRKYNQTSFMLYGPLNDGDIVIKEDARRIFIFIQGFKAIKNILRIFGDLIQKIEISFEKIGIAESKEIVKHINDHSSGTLLNFTLKNCKKNVLDELKATFRNVKTLSLSTLSSSKLEISPNAIKLSKVFPNLNRLHLGSTKTTDWELIGGTFSRLKYLDVEVPRTFKRRSRPDDSYVLNLLRSNPQIETLLLGKSTLKLLKGACELPHLRTLVLNGLSDKYFNYVGDPVRFINTVEFLTIESDRSNNIPENVQFSRIQELSLNIKLELNNKWIEFINNQVNNDITELKLDMMNVFISNENLWSIAEMLPTLKRASIECSRKFSANDILMFIEKSTTLLKLDLNIWISETEEKEFYDNLPQNDDWNISRSAPDGRKINIVLEKLEKHENVVEIETGTEANSVVETSEAMQFSTNAWIISCTLVFIGIFRMIELNF